MADLADYRQMEERRFGAIQALNAVVESIKTSNPQTLFYDDNGETVLDPTKIQSMCNRWADKAADVLIGALELAERINLDALNLFHDQAPAEPAGPRVAA